MSAMFGLKINYYYRVVDNSTAAQNTNNGRFSIELANLNGRTNDETCEFTPNDTFHTRFEYFGAKLSDERMGDI